MSTKSINFFQNSIKPKYAHRKHWSFPKIRENYSKINLKMTYKSFENFPPPSKKKKKKKKEKRKMAVNYYLKVDQNYQFYKNL